MAGPWTEDEQLGLNLKKEYILKHHPSAHAEFMAEAGRWVVFGRGKYNESLTIGTGGSERAAWQSAYKYTQESFSPIPVSTPKISTASSKGSLEYPAVCDPYTGLWKPLSTDTMPVGWHPEREYTTGEVVYMKDGGTKVYANGKLHDLISHKTIAGETMQMNPITNEVFHSNVLAQGAKTAQGIAALKQQAESGALGKLKQSIDKKFNMHVGQYIPVDNEGDFQVLTKDKIKPIDSSSKYKVKFTETLKPMILPKKPALEEDDEEFAPVPTKKDKPFSSINVKADLTNQALVQHIGVASNCNVIIQQAFSSKGAFGRKVRLVCKQCNKDKVYFDEAVFHMTPEGIVNELTEFCLAHRHDGSKVEMPWKTVVVPDPKKLENFRRFRED